MSAPLWTPSPDRIAASRVRAFADRIEAAEGGTALLDHASLHAWSVAHPEAFWRSVWQFCGVVGDLEGPAIADPGAMPGSRFFPEARLNFAENLLGNSPDEALVFRGEEGSPRRVRRHELREQVLALAARLRSLGIGPGDRVAGYLPNIPEAVVAMLATAAIGATWTSCSPDFGVAGIVDRFGQVGPRVLFFATGYTYKGRRHDCVERARRALESLPTIEQVIVVTGDGSEPPVELPCSPWTFEEALEIEPLPEPLPRFPFNHPLYILYSSGTTGRPKCIVHGAGGTLLKHLAEHQLMCDVKPGDRIFYFTTLGWMMWNWLVSALASGATLLLFDGNPFWPGADVLWDFTSAERCTLFGTSAKYIEALRNAEWRPAERHDFGRLRTITSTGSPLAPESFDYVYEAIGADLCLSSISGGTDIVGCFVGGDPTGPVWRGEIQAPVLGMDVDIVDEQGRTIRQQKGELVCRAPFPSMPLGFWGDDDGSRYRAAYFERYPGMWHQGDYAEMTEHGGIVMLGRSDATLNPGGVRIGTAEIYRQVERIPEVEEAVVIGQDHGDDVRVVLFVKLRGDLRLDDTMRDRIRREIRAGASPRHVPAVILQVDDIPRTKSGKIVELAVRDVVHGREIAQREALANPDALEQFRDRPELRT